MSAMTAAPVGVIADGVSPQPVFPITIDATHDLNAKTGDIISPPSYSPGTNEVGAYIIGGVGKLKGTYHILADGTIQ